jgi:hypothetical protein
MTAIKEYLGKIRSWIMERSFGLIVGLLVIGYIVLSNQALEEERQGRMAQLQCSSMCFPKQSEFIVKLNVETCWCYVDSTSMKIMQSNLEE